MLYFVWRYRARGSGGARILEEVGPVAGPKVLWQCLKLFGLTIII